jgi:hypothetical protein
MFSQRNGRSAFLVLLVVASAMLMVSCLGIEMDIKINNDGSGTAEMAFKISQMFFQMGPEAGEVPIPLSREELESTYEGVPGVTVVDVKEEDTEENKTITATLSFKDFAALTAGEDDMFQGTSLTREGGSNVFRAVIKEAVEPGEEGEEDLEQEEMIKPYYEGYYFVYKVTAPQRVRSHSLGDLSDNGRVVTYRVAMYDFNMMENEEPLVMEVRW